MSILSMHSRLQKLAKEIERLPVKQRIPLQIKLNNLKAQYFRSPSK